MPNLTVVSTSAGITEITSALSDILSLDITKYEIGDSAGYTPTAGQTALNGTKVFEDGDSGGSIEKTLVGTNSVELKITLDNTVDGLTIGEYLFKNSSGTVMAIAVFDSTIAKSSGSTLELKVLIHITDTGGVTITNSNVVHNSINVVDVEGSLPNFVTASSNLQMVKEYNGQGAHAIAYKNSDDSQWEYFTQVQGGTVNNDEIVLANANRTIKTSSKIISDDADFTTDASNKVPTKAAVESRLQALVDSAPGALDTLNELAAALGDDANFATTVTNSIATKLSIANNLSDLNNIETAKNNLELPTVYAKNRIINGDLDIWQRNISFAAATNGLYSADRWRYTVVGDMVHTVAQSSDVPTAAQAGRVINYSLLVDCTTVDASLAVGAISRIEQRIEGYNFRTIAQKVITLSFWVKATKTGIYCVSFRNSGFDKSYVTEYTVSSADTWEFKTVTIAASPSAGTWDYTNGGGIYVGWTLAAGTNWETTADAWQDGDYSSTSNQVNATDNTNNNFRITGVQLEEGDIQTQFDCRTIQEEFLLSQRYFKKTYEANTPVGTATNSGFEGSLAYNTTDFYGFGITRFQNKMRSTPTVSIYNPTTGSVNSIRDSSAATNKTPNVSTISSEGFRITATSMVANNAYLWHYTAESEL